jgi:hypothetical protein
MRNTPPICWQRAKPAKLPQDRFIGSAVTGLFLFLVVKRSISMFNVEQHFDGQRNLLVSIESGECADEREPLIVDWDELERRRWASGYLA